MTITITSEKLNKKTSISREYLRKIMIERWGWNQGKADSHLIFLEMRPHVLTIETPQGELKLQAIG
jgi:hypothetical protein